MRSATMATLATTLGLIIIHSPLMTSFIHFLSISFALDSA